MLSWVTTNDQKFPEISPRWHKKALFSHNITFFIGAHRLAEVSCAFFHRLPNVLAEEWNAKFAFVNACNLQFSHKLVVVLLGGALGIHRTGRLPVHHGEMLSDITDDVSESGRY